MRCLQPLPDNPLLDYGKNIGTLVLHIITWWRSDKWNKKNVIVWMLLKVEVLHINNSNTIHLVSIDNNSMIWRKLVQTFNWIIIFQVTYKQCLKMILMSRAEKRMFLRKRKFYFWSFAVCLCTWLCRSFILTKVFGIRPVNVLSQWLQHNP